MNIADVQRCCLEKNVPFFSYRLPEEKDIFWGTGGVLSFQRMEDIAGLEGFVVVPFEESPESPSLFICKELSFGNETDDINLEEQLLLFRLPMNDTSSSERLDQTIDSEQLYHAQINQLLANLKMKQIDKVVLSREIEIWPDKSKGKIFDIVPEWFQKLAIAYPDAFVFLVSVPGVMTWMGATPELFLKQEREKVETMALAGTRIAEKTMETKEVTWGKKEYHEQEYVSRYISEVLKAYGSWDVKGPFTKIAGNVEHLCTSFVHVGNFSPDIVEHIRRKLHPTPAVGGYPSVRALEIMKRIECHDRKYYAGYLGPVETEFHFRWYVNLRSMALFPEKVLLYVGGGVTAESDPDLEWEETEMKARTLLDVILS